MQQQQSSEWKKVSREQTEDKMKEVCWNKSKLEHKVKDEVSIESEDLATFYLLFCCDFTIECQSLSGANGIIKF